MSEPIYFSKVEFKERLIYSHIRSSILLDLVKGELSYQRYQWEEQMPVISRVSFDEFNGKHYTKAVNIPARFIKSGKIDLKQKLVPDEKYIQKVVFSYGIKLSETQLQQLLPYCNALEFEPYRNRKMSMSDDGYIGYRDEINIYFTGITDSQIPKMEWNMLYYYDEAHIWPSERLYRYLVMKYFLNNKKLKGFVPCYGELSLFC